MGWNLNYSLYTGIRWIFWGICIFAYISNNKYMYILFILAKSEKPCSSFLTGIEWISPWIVPFQNFFKWNSHSYSVLKKKFSNGHLSVMSLKADREWFSPVIVLSLSAIFTNLGVSVRGLPNFSAAYSENCATYSKFYRHHCLYISYISSTERGYI